MDAEERAIRRPTLRVELLDEDKNEDEKVLATTRALVDSGADYTTFPSDWAALLGIDVQGDDECRPVEVGIPHKSPATHYMYTGGLTIRVVDETFFLHTVKFCDGLDVAYLGRKDFFDRYVVLFNHRELCFYLERLPDPDEGDDAEPDCEVVRPIMPTG